MIQVVKKEDRHFSDLGWLKTFWLFSFANYFDPQNIQFGALRVFNDDIVAPGTGFPTHPHEDMEIITLVIDGEMTHQDSMGNKTVIKTNDVQRMSAGTGITHSEFNLADRPVHFYQIWIFPDKSSLKPSYDQRNYDPSCWKNKFFPVASGQKIKDTVTFNNDSTVYRASLEKSEGIVFQKTKGRRIFVYVTKGEILINNHELLESWQARIDEDDELKFFARKDSEIILIDVPSCQGWGYDEATLKGVKK